MNEYYRNLVQGGAHTVALTPEEEAAVLHAYDEGIEALGPTERHHLDRVIGKLKDQIWP